MMPMWGDWNPLMPMMMMQMSAMNEGGYGPMKGFKGKGKGFKGKGKGKGKGPYGKGAGKGVRPVKTKEAREMPNYKGKVTEYIAKKYKRVPTAEELTFTTDNEPGTKLFKCTVHLKIDDEDFECVGEGQADKKVAEQAACGELLLIVDPTLHEKAQQMKQEELTKLQAEMENLEGENGAVKGMFNTGALEPKGKLNQVLMKIAGRSLAKGDVVYTTSQVEGGFQAHCEITFRGETYVGEVKSDKKAAEKAAAEIVLQSLRDEIGKI